MTKDILELKEKCKKPGIELPLSNDIKALKQELMIGGKNLANRIAVQPMEGCDGEPSGAVSALTERRYKRFAESGAAMIWFEATAVVPEGRANPRQFYINEHTKDSFKALVDEIKEISIQANGFAPMIICQLTHSGRHSKPNGKPEPLTAYRNPIFEKAQGIESPPVLSDDYLDALPQKFAEAAILAENCGFDGVDVKCCHGYLLSEFLSAYQRENSPYGGSFENRTRLFLNTVDSVKSAVSNNFTVTSRLNVYDGFEYPYGFSTKPDQGITPCLEEAEKLIEILCDTYQYGLLNITAGNPYVNPHVNRPFHLGAYEAPEDPLIGVERMIGFAGKIKRRFPALNIVSSAHSYLGASSPYLAAGAVKQGYTDIAGFGRMAIAYPHFAKDILSGSFDPAKVCIACSKCSELMRAGGVAGCVIRNAEIYLQKYKEFCVK